MSWVVDVCAVLGIVLYGFNTLMRLTKFIPQPDKEVTEPTPMSEEAKRLYS